MILSPPEQSKDKNVVPDTDARLLAIKENLVNRGRELGWELTQDTVKLLAEVAYRDEVGRQKDEVTIGEGSASGTIDPRLEAMKKYLIDSWVDEEQTAETILCLVQHYGLLHQPVPEAGKTTRDILKEAKAMAARAAKATLHALVRKLMSTELERRVEAARQLAQTKIESQSYQTERGDRVIPRFPTHEDRQISPTGCRPEHEVTAFLQVASRYLETHQKLGANSCVHCLAGVRCIAEGELSPSLSSIQKMKERNRVRLKGATFLEKKDYQVAISVALGVDSKRNIRRQRALSLAMTVLSYGVGVKDQPGVSAVDRERAERELADQFGLADIA